MFCSNCGKELGADVKFCSNCGSAVGAALVPSENSDNVARAGKYTEDEVEEQFDKYTRNVTEGDVSGVLEKEEAILNKVKGPLGKFVHSIKMLFSLIKDYSRGTYRELPWTTIAAIVGCLLYIFSPIDLIPDFIPVLGLTDDASVLTLMLSSGVGSDLKKYEQWKNSRKQQYVIT